MQSKAATVGEYLKTLDPDRRQAIETVRQVILKNLDKGYQEGMQYGMIGYYVPHSIFPAGYHCDPKQPLPFVSLASQKNYMSLYLMGVYCGCADDGGDLSPEARWFREAWARTGKKLDMGKACLRFKKIEDLALDIIGESVKRIPAKQYIERYLEAISRPREPGKPAAKAKAARKAGTSTTRKSSAAARSPKSKASVTARAKPRGAARSSAGKRSA